MVLFKKLHAACCKNGILIAICAQSSLATLMYDGATTVHSLFSYPVKDENDRQSEPTKMQFQQQMLQLSLCGISNILG